jgi:hypothetical protein
MNALLNTTSHVNGDRPVNGRGLGHLKLTENELVRLAADMATGTRPFQPSVTQTTLLTGVSATKIRAEIKARAAQYENGWLKETDAIVHAWDTASSDNVRREAFHIIGPARVWDVLASVIA